MKKEVARDVAHFLNTPKIIDTLIAYSEDRINSLRMVSDTANDPIELYRVQGAIKELKELIKIRDNALATINVQKG